MAHSQLSDYFEDMMQYLDEKQRIKLGYYAKIVVHDSDNHDDDDF